MASNPWLEGIEAIVLRTVNDQPTLWDSILPAEALVMSAELTRVDQLLDDPVFFAPFVPFFDPRQGRPSIPMETYLRLMFLKFRYRLGYETLCREVTDSISWQRFCSYPAGHSGAAPDDADEDHHQVRRRDGCGVERGAAGQGRGGEAAADEPGPCRHHGRGGGGGVSDRFGVAGQGGRTDRADRGADEGRRRRDPHPIPGSAPRCRSAGAGDRGEVEAARRATA